MSDLQAVFHRMQIGCAPWIHSDSLGDRLADDRGGVDFETLPVDEWTMDECWVWLAAEGAISCDSAMDDVYDARRLVRIVMKETGMVESV